MTGQLVVEQVTAPLAEHGEGPVYWPAWSTGPLRWVDMLAGDVLSMIEGGEVRRSHVGRVAAAIRPRARGGMVVATENGFALFDGSLGDGELTAEARIAVWSDPSIRMNDGGCDPLGRFLCGSMAYDARPNAGSLYRLDADLAVTAVLAGVTVSNGLAWSADGKLAYYVDSALGSIDVFESDAGELAGRRTLVQFDEHDGTPDGLCLDAEGHIWIAMHGGASVHRFSPSGTREATLSLPVSGVTACTFGGPDLATLFITTSRLGMGESAEPAAGALFAAQPGVVGAPVTAFAG
jgi:sugar lactone lactonase YvrE